MSAIDSENLSSPKDVIGTVKFFNDAKGWGFATVEGIETDVFLHYRHIIAESENEFRVLVKNQLILFEPTVTSKGWLASKIRKIG